MVSDFIMLFYDNFTNFTYIMINITIGSFIYDQIFYSDGSCPEDNDRDQIFVFT